MMTTLPHINHLTKNYDLHVENGIPHITDDGNGNPQKKRQTVEWPSSFTIHIQEC
jgi:hypothetical protein